MKKMAVGHHLGEDSHMIERSHNLEEGGSEWVCDQCEVEIWVCDWIGEWSETRELDGCLGQDTSAHGM